MLPCDPALGNVTFQYLTFVINSPPSVMLLVVGLHENLVNLPSPVRVRTHPAEPVSPDLSIKHRAKSIPTVPHRFVTDVDAALVQEIFDIPQRKEKSNVKHHCQTDDFRAGLEVLEWRALCHPRRLGRCAARLKWVLSDSALSAVLTKLARASQTFFWLSATAKMMMPPRAISC